MTEAIINYIPELIGGILLVLLTFGLTRVTEKSKTRKQLYDEKEKHNNDKEKLILEFDAKLKQQELKFKNQLKVINKQHEFDLEKYQMESQDQDLKSIFTGKYDIGKIGEQMEGLGDLLGKADKVKRQLESGNLKNGQHPARRGK